jgi:hypothetical protein
MKEYRVKKGLKMLIYVLASLAIVLYGGLTIVLIIPPFNTTTQEMHQSMPGLWLLGLFLAMVISMIVVIVSIKKRKVIITNEAVISHSLLGKTELKLYEIKGFRLDAVPKYPQFQHIIIDAFDTKKKSIRINPFLENMGELRANLNLKLKNLDNQKIENLKEKFKNEEQEILKNNDFGLSIEERESKLKKARLTAGVLNGAGVAIGLWTFFFPKPYEYAIIACIILPLITIVSIKFWKGLIRIETEKGSAYPSATGGIIFPAIALALRSIIDFSIDDYSNIWIPSILIAVVLTTILFVGNKDLLFKNGKDYFIVFTFMIFSFAYGYGTVVTTNCVFDESEPLLFDSHVVSKEISGGRKTTSYDLKISPWANKTEVEKVSVDRELYESVEAGNRVLVYQFKGRFDIPWVVVGYGR